MKKARLLAIVAAFVAAAAGYASAERLVSDDKALAEMLPGSAGMDKVAVPVTAGELAAIKKQLGGSLNADGKAGADPKELVFYFGVDKTGKRTGVALLDSQPGKWGEIGFAVGLDANTGKILNMAVTTMNEKRGRPIALRSFLKQFFGKDKSAPFTVGKDVNAVSGATISTRAAAFEARRAVIVYNELFPKK